MFLEPKSQWKSLLAVRAERHAFVVWQTVPYVELLAFMELLHGKD